jgi:hypothetical protein
MIKARFGGYVRATSPEGQVNSVLLKCVAHNLVQVAAFVQNCVLPRDPNFLNPPRPPSREERPMEIAMSDEGRAAHPILGVVR